MGKLHQTLSVEPELKQVATQMQLEAIKTFQRRQDHFEGWYRTYERRTEDTPIFEPEKKPLTTTVKAKLTYLEEHLVRFLDCTYQKEATNQLAKSDVVINGEVVLKDVPATYLLFLEKYLKQLKQVYLQIPTLDPAKHWLEDTNEDNVWYHTVKSNKTEKKQDRLVLYEATDKHPAQVEKIVVDSVVGEWTKKVVSGEMTPKRKHQVLSNLEELIRAVITARCKANDQDIVSEPIAKKLFEIINK